MTALRRTELARRAGIHPETVRYYESRGLLEAARRSAAGHRLYSEDAVRQARLVRWASSLGMSLNDVAIALGSRRSLQALAERRAREVAEEITFLRERHADLLRLAQCACSGECPEIARVLKRPVGEEGRARKASMFTGARPPRRSGGTKGRRK
jgi:DNA-binding transcriptional MerR regulator